MSKRRVYLLFMKSQSLGERVSQFESFLGITGDQSVGDQGLILLTLRGGNLCVRFAPQLMIQKGNS